MKLRFLSLLLLSVLVCGCYDSIEKSQDLDMTTFTASIEQDEATKTLLGSWSGGQRKVQWKSTDELIVGGGAKPDILSRQRYGRNHYVDHCAAGELRG